MFNPGERAEQAVQQHPIRRSMAGGVRSAYHRSLLLMKTFSITTLGCRVNHYEAEQLAALLRQRGLVAAAPGEAADVRIVHTCSVTIQAASKSRQSVRRATRLPVLCSVPGGEGGHGCEGVTDP